MTRAAELSPNQIERAPRWLLVLLALVALAIPITIGVLKINALVLWRYTSDLFTVDTMLAETLRGNFMMEFAYGRQFGDHACLIFVALVPIKWLLGTKMVFLLVLLPAITFAVCGLVLFRSMRDIAGSRWAALATMIYFVSVGAIRGPFERVFGFHIDTLSGYVAVAMAALLMRREATGRGAVGCIIAVVIYALLKEEMALLGAVFFAALLILGKRDRIHAVALVVCIVIFAAEMWVIHVSRTGWNRGNEALVGIFFRQVRELGVIGFFFSANKIEYWSYVVGSLVVFAACAGIAGRLNHYALALLLAGLAKLVFAWFIPDFYPWTWHNYPALVMLTGATAIQLTELRFVPARASAVAATVVGASFAVFALRELPFVIAQVRDFGVARAERDRLRPALLDVIEKTDRMKLASVPKWTAYEWSQANQRHTFFPHGITNSPQGTADFLVTRRSKNLEEPEQTKAFTLVYQNGHWRLWRRSGYLPLEEASRAEFIRIFGRESIGLPAEKAKKKPPKKKRKPAAAPTTSSLR